jgi:N-acetylglucosaminyldiphosphoundecaprenol N-acetyl-beta-D-mannosaminyltransferase
MLSSGINAFGLCFRLLKQQSFFEHNLNSIKFVVTVNAEFVAEAHRNPRFMALINNNYATLDGQIPYLLSRLTNRNRSYDKLSGSDLLMKAVSHCAKTNESLFFLGADEETNKKAVEKAHSLGVAKCAGFSPEYCDYPFEEKFNQEILDRIAQAQPDYLFVGFGAKKQEFWIADNLDKLEKIGIKVVIGSGGSFSFLAQTIKRAPHKVQRMGLEGIYRLLQEPSWFRVKRLLKSFLIFYYFVKCDLLRLN